MQNAIESFNGRWQAKVWARFHHDDLPALQAQSAKYIMAYRQRQAGRIKKSPVRRPFPKRWKFDPNAKVRGQIILIRRTSDQGTVSVSGHQLEVAKHWIHRLVRCVVDIDAKVVRFTHCAVESRSNNLYFKRWFILCRLVMWQIENAVTEVLALAQ